MIELSVERGPQEVQQAMVQFAARRSYRLTKPWWIEGIRIEAPQKAHPRKGEAGLGTFWASLWDLPQAPRIEVVVKRKRGTSRLKISVSNHPESIQLAYELHTYLLDERSYDGQCPPICPRCGNPVRTVTARYCGRCGQRLVPGSPAAPLPLMDQDDAGRSVYDAWEPPAPAPVRFSRSAAEADLEDSVELLIEPEEADESDDAAKVDAREPSRPRETIMAAEAEAEPTANPADLLDADEPAPVESPPAVPAEDSARPTGERSPAGLSEPPGPDAALPGSEAEAEETSEMEPPVVEEEEDPPPQEDEPLRRRRALAED